MRGLYKDDSTNRKQLTNWERTVLAQFEAKMTDKAKPFPCIPATIGFSLNHLRYGFIGNPTDHSTVIELAELLSDFTKAAREFGNYTSLIVFYHIPQQMKDTYVVEDYEKLFWEQLNKLTTMDDQNWPAEIPSDPHHSIWEFCFHNERYFMYCATPAHTNRKSRHFDTLMLAITPRWVLEEFHTSENYAKKIKKHIRRRLANYDSTSIHPDLKSYGDEDNFEWRQYFLRDDDTALAKCPFHRLTRLFK